jgi:5-methylcytosine-specific restriction protein A
MPFCLQPGCSVLVPRGRCPTHTDRSLHGTRTWYYSARWVRLRQQVLQNQAYSCAVCGRVSTHLDVDHVRKHQGDPAWFWNPDNLQALCATCHTQKTRRGA